MGSPIPYGHYAYVEGLEKYVSHRVVRAAKIKHVFSDTCVGLEPNGMAISFDPRNKPIPEVGWFAINYEDGYLSFCPPEQFKEGYAKGDEVLKVGLIEDMKREQEA